jgi:hypothetical protein
MKKFIYNILVISVGLALFSCSDFLDKVPDNRAELRAPDQITKLLVDGYILGNYSLIAELSGDNFIDNNSPDDNGNRNNLASYDRADDEAFAWEDIVSSNRQDSPSAIWESAYHAIAVANHALQQIQELEAAGRGNEVSAQKGEALLIRAFNHFNLVNIFAHAYRTEELSKNDPGVPYVTEPERVVMVSAERLSVAEVYKRIEEDVTEGLPLIDDAIYTVPKYHFNRVAANAFAARFYLYKKDYDKVIKHANAALGSDPSLCMRNWNVELPSFDAIVNWIINASSSNNFMLVSTYSSALRHYTGSHRYSCNRDAAKATLDGPGPSWPDYNYHPCYSGKRFINGEAEYGVFFPKAGESFEYIDKVAGIGYPHIVRTEFTGEETLLCRAEAYIHQNKLGEALADLQIWDKSRQNVPVIATFTQLTEEAITRFYTRAMYGVVKPLNTEKMDPTWIIDSKQELYLQCVLHFRRMETQFDGLRWFDIKRYGIEIEHKIGRSRMEKLTWDDPRRALQLPIEVISAGMQPNSRDILPALPEPVKSNVELKIVNNNEKDVL